MIRTRIVRAAVMLVLAGWVPGAFAHEGHEHGNGADLQPARATAPRAEVASDAFELVVIARGSELWLHLDGFRTNEPVTGAAVEVDGPTGTLKAGEVTPGVYSVGAPFLAEPGNYDLAVTVQSRGAVDLLATTLRIPSGPGPKPPLRDVAQRFPDGSLFVAKASQQILALRTQFTEHG